MMDLSSYIFEMPELHSLMPKVASAHEHWHRASPRPRGDHEGDVDEYYYYDDDGNYNDPYYNSGSNPIG